MGSGVSSRGGSGAASPSITATPAFAGEPDVCREQAADPAAETRRFVPHDRNRVLSGLTVTTSSPSSYPSSTRAVQGLSPLSAQYADNVAADGSLRDNSYNLRVPSASSAPTSPVHSTRRFKPVVREPACTLHPLTALELAALLASQNAKTLLIDVRPYTMFSYTHINSAISICIPSTLLKRPTFGFRKIMDFMAPQDVEALDQVADCSHIIFYDQFTANCTEGSTLSRTAAKFLDADPDIAPKLHWVVGGLAAVARDVPELVEAGEDLLASLRSEGQDADGNSLDLDCCSSGGPKALGGSSSCTNDDTPKLTLSSIKAAPRSPFSLVPVVTAIGAGLRSPINTPSRINPPLDESSSIHVDGEIAHRLLEFPQWLRKVVKLSESGHNVLAEAFQRLQAAELQRVSPGSNGSGGGRSRALPRDQRPLLSPKMKLASPGSSPCTPFSESSMLSIQSTSSTNTSPMDVQAYSSKLKRHQRDNSYGIIPPSPREASSSFQEGQFMIIAGDDPRKNRYTNIAPFGYNRVMVRGSEYLNASYIGSRLSPLRYIATQAPVPASFGDFWWCVYEQKTPIIIMLTTLRTESGQVKGNKYWFDSEYDGLKVRLLEEGEHKFNYNDHVLNVRRVQLESPTGDIHNVIHLQYQDWPDLGCPADPNDVLEIIDFKRSLMQDMDKGSNVIVHCSAGCGRTGTFCTIDTVTDYLSNLSWSDAQQDPKDRILDVVSEFREQRIAMVQNQRQLLLCYEAVMLWYLRQLENGMNHDGA